MNRRIEERGVEILLNEVTI